MKTMTCKQLGGPCNVEHRGKDHNEVIKAHDRHLKAQVAAGDETHRDAHEAMRGRWKRPVSGLGWYRDVKREVCTPVAVVSQRGAEVAPPALQPPLPRLPPGASHVPRDGALERRVHNDAITQTLVPDGDAP